MTRSRVRLGPQFRSFRVVLVSPCSEAFRDSIESGTSPVPHAPDLFSSCFFRGTLTVWLTV